MNMRTKVINIKISNFFFIFVWRGFTSKNYYLQLLAVLGNNVKITTGLTLVQTYTVLFSYGKYHLTSVCSFTIPLNSRRKDSDARKTF